MLARAADDLLRIYMELLPELLLHDDRWRRASRSLQQPALTLAIPIRLNRISLIQAVRGLMYPANDLNQ